jgi:membrane protein implicated in regulation of membrane protease activity
MSWWIWMILGLACLAFEASCSAGFFAFFLGLAAIILGFLELVVPSLPNDSHWYLFVALSIVLIALFRQRLLQKKSKEFEDIVNETVLLESDLAPGAKGSGELRGTKWKVHNTGSELRKAGESVAVKALRGFTLEI